MIPTFQGEIQLAGWSDTHNGGAKVAFWLPDAESLDVFKGLTAKKGNVAGHRFACVLVEIGEDELPVETLSTPAAEIVKGGALARLAGMWCADSAFWAWLGDTGLAVGVESERGCATAIRNICMVDSRAELDHCPLSAKIFNERIREPYRDFLKAE